MSLMNQQVHLNKQTVSQDQTSPPSSKRTPGLPCAQSPVVWGALFKPLVLKSKSE